MGTLTDDVPPDHIPFITASYKTRVRSQDGKMTVATLVATAQQTLNLFAKQKSLSTLDLPFADCCKLLHLPFISCSSCMNYAVALSQSKRVAVLDLELAKVVKSWNNVEDIEVKDELCLGYPQLVLVFRGSRRLTVTPEFGWEPHNDYEYNDMFDEEPSNSAVHSVVTALENQLKSACNELQSKQNQLWLRKSLLNRSLTALSRNVTLQPCKLRAPSYTLPIRGEPQLKGAEDDSDDGLLLRASELWQVLDILTCSWIIGVAFQISSDCTLSNIKCALVVKNAVYHINYYVERHGKETSRLLPFSGALNQGDRLFVTAVTNIPEFKIEEVEVAHLFLTCNAINRPEKLFQYNLGSCCLSFSDLADESLSFNHIINRQPIPHEQMYSLLSLLSYEEKYSIHVSDNQNISKYMLNDLAIKLNLLYNPTIRCFYSFSFYGHVAMLVQEENDRKLTISIRTSKSGDMRLFVRHLKNNLKDGATLTLSPPETAPDATPHELLASGFDLLSSGKLEEDDEPMEVTEKPNESQIEKIRRAFLKKQKLTINAGQTSHIVLPNDAYCKWQDNYFACE